jgi:hypothetical protein
MISIESKRLFSIGNRCDVLQFFTWLLSTLQKVIDPKKKGISESSVLYEPFQVCSLMFCGGFPHLLVFFFS